MRADTQIRTEIQQDTYRQKDKKTYRQTDKQIDKQTDRQTHRHANIQLDILAHRLTYR